MARFVGSETFLVSGEPDRFSHHFLKCVDATRWPTHGHAAFAWMNRINLKPVSRFAFELRFDYEPVDPQSASRRIGIALGWKPSTLMPCGRDICALSASRKTLSPARWSLMSTVATRSSDVRSSSLFRLPVSITSTVRGGSLLISSDLRPDEVELHIDVRGHGFDFVRLPTTRGRLRSPMKEVSDSSLRGRSGAAASQRDSVPVCGSGGVTSSMS